MSRIEDVWGERTPYARGSQWPTRVDEHLTVPRDQVERWVQSACVLCSNGCGLDIAVSGGKVVGVRGREQDRINHGRLGPKGLYGWQANNSPDRLTAPLVRKDGQLQQATWDEAMGLVAARTTQLLRERGPLSLGFYTSGQLFSEEYYALAKLARGGLGTPHLDGNTRLCTATAEWALIETFGTDGDPGSYTDIDECDTLFLVGHNVAETQTVLWMRMLDRLHGPNRPKLVVVDPRSTPAAREADVWLPIRSGTNVALLNAILHELIVHEWLDEAFIREHTVGFEALQKTVLSYPPERAAEICGVPADDIRRAAEIIGRTPRLVSTCLQGVYQSNQATAAAVQLNNVNLLRGMIGRPGCAVFQMNGQPTAQNTRETGPDGDREAVAGHDVDDLAVVLTGRQPHLAAPREEEPDLLHGPVHDGGRHRAARQLEVGAAAALGRQEDPDVGPIGRRDRGGGGQSHRLPGGHGAGLCQTGRYAATATMSASASMLSSGSTRSEGLATSARTRPRPATTAVAAKPRA